jgi:uncharacterized protein YegP (UPF0339 family)
MKYEYWKSAGDRKWYWHLKAANGEKIAQSEGYTSKHDCVHAIQLVKSSSNAPEVNLTPSEI